LSASTSIIAKAKASLMGPMARLMLCPAFIRLAMSTDYIQVFDDSGDLFVVLGRRGGSRDGLARECVASLHRALGAGTLRTDREGRLVLTILTSHKDGR